MIDRSNDFNSASKNTKKSAVDELQESVRAMDFGGLQSFLGAIPKASETEKSKSLSFWSHNDDSLTTSFTSRSRRQSYKPLKRNEPDALKKRSLKKKRFSI